MNLPNLLPIKDAFLRLYMLEVEKNLRNMQTYACELFRNSLVESENVKEAFIEGLEFDSRSIYIKQDWGNFPFQLVLIYSDQEVYSLLWKHLEDVHESKPESRHNLPKDMEFGMETGATLAEIPEQFVEELNSFFCIYFESWLSLHMVHDQFRGRMYDWGEALITELKGQPTLPRFRKFKPAEHDQDGFFLPNINPSLLEEQRLILQAMELPEGKEREAVDGIVNMLNAWSDDIYYKNK